jgi:two-component system cell cycle response regulator
MASVRGRPSPLHSQVGDRLLTGTMVILLIEDSPADVRLIREQLAEVSQLYVELRVAESLGAGLIELGRARPDVVLLDLGLPDSQGMDTLLRVRASLSNVPIVVLTGLDDEALSVQLVRAGAQDCLVKGWQNGRQLTRTLRNSIQRQKLQRELRNLAAAPAPAMEDDLTGLHNRYSFMVLARQALKVAHRGRTRLIMLRLNAEGPKAGIDSLWRASGDQVALEIANLLRATFRESDIMARLEGDEFAVLAPVAAEPQGDTESLLTRLWTNLNALSDRLCDRPDRAARLVFSVGVARFDPAKACAVEELFSQADRSRYEESARQRTP